MLELSDEVQKTGTSAGNLAAMGPPSLNKEQTEDEARRAGLSGTLQERFAKSELEAADEFAAMRRLDVERSRAEVHEMNEKLVEMCVVQKRDETRSHGLHGVPPR